MDPGGSQNYVVGMYVEVGSDDNTGAGFEILSVNYTLDTVTLESAPSPSGAQEITPWWPSSGAEVGKPVHGKTGIVTVNGQNAIVLSGILTLNNNIKYYDYEKNNLWTAEKYGRPGKREVDGTLELHFLERGPSYWYRAEYQEHNALIIPSGKTEGYIMELSVPFAEYMTPTLSGEEEFIQTIPFQGISEGALNDEFKIVFK